MIATTLLLAAFGQAAAVPAAQAPAAAGQKTVCKLESEAYSRIPVRVCRTQAEWDEIAKQAEADLRASRNQRVLSPNPKSK